MFSPVHALKILFLSAISLFPLLQDAKAGRLKVACVGDSITFGVGTDNLKKESYPSRLQTLLGKKRWKVENFGISGRTLLRKADPLDYSAALNNNPDVVIIALGTNDSKTHIWRKYHDGFVGDYVTMIKEFKALPSRPKIFVCLPPPAFPGDWGITQDAIRDKVIPSIRKAAQETGVETIDLNTPLKSSGELFPDTVHPNNQGALRIAEIVAQAINERG